MWLSAPGLAFSPPFPARLAQALYQNLKKKKREGRKCSKNSAALMNLSLLFLYVSLFALNSHVTDRNFIC